MKPRCALAIVACLTAGCVTEPTQPGNTYLASYVGDRSSMHFDEIVVTIRRGDAPEAYKNLHIFLGAIINPTRRTTGDTYDVQTIIWNTRTRVASEIVADLTGADDLPMDLGELKERVLSKAQTVFDPIYSKWTHADAFDVEIVVTSLFLTDGSVGKSQRQSTFWWD